MRKFILLIILFIISLFFQPVHAEENPWTHTVYFENDLFTGTDSNYTNGVKYSVISPDLSKDAPDGKLPRQIMEYVHKLPIIKDSGPEYSHQFEFSIGQNMFTPSDITRYDLIRDDRPYAGWLYFSTSYHRKHSKKRSVSFMDTVELQLGIVGPESFAEDTQKLVHKLRDLQRPNGWDNQLKNEPGLVVAFERKLLFHPVDSHKAGYDAIIHAGAAVGNVHTYLNGGFEIRAGWNIPRHFGVSIIRPAGSTRLKIDKDFSVFGFGAVNGKIVFRDIFVDGNSFTDSHRVKRKPYVADLAAGVAVSFQRLILTWTQVLRTKEFKGQTDTHSFGSIAISYSFPFDLRNIFNKRSEINGTTT
jgi:hypothetical protein